MAKATGSTNAVKICFSILGEIKVDDNIDSLDIDTTSEKIRTDEISGDAGTEVVEDLVSMLLHHAGMRVEAGVAKLGDLLGQQLDTVGGVAEDDGLVDLKFGEEGVQAVDLLLLFNEGVVLGDTPEGEFVHEVDLIWFLHMLVFEFLDHHWECGREEHDLSISGVEIQQLFNNHCEFGREKFVSFIHDEYGAF